MPCAKYSAVFFTLTGDLLIDIKRNCAFMPFFQGAKYLDIKSAVLDNKIVIVQGIPKEHSPLSIHNAKHFLATLDPQSLRVLLRAIHWVSWDQKIKYCSSCGGTLHKLKDLPEKNCLSCNSHFYPNLAPAIMVLIKHNKQILLARSPSFTPGMYAPLAGFVDLGETAEDAIHREVREEVGLRIHHLTYFGSQSWPFPSSFMMAFTADYIDSKISTDNKEIEDVQWFTADNLPVLPPVSSIARSLIDNTLKNL